MIGCDHPSCQYQWVSSWISHPLKMLITLSSIYPALGSNIRFQTSGIARNVVRRPSPWKSAKGARNRYPFTIVYLLYPPSTFGIIFDHLWLAKEISKNRNWSTDWRKDWDCGAHTRLPEYQLWAVSLEWRDSSWTQWPQLHSCEKVQPQEIRSVPTWSFCIIACEQGYPPICSIFQIQFVKRAESSSSPLWKKYSQGFVAFGTVPKRPNFMIVQDAPKAGLCTIEIGLSGDVSLSVYLIYYE